VLGVVDDGAAALASLLAHEPKPHDPAQFLPMHAGTDSAARIRGDRQA
jgi:hypothetical protein